MLSHSRSGRVSLRGSRFTGRPISGSGIAIRYGLCRHLDFLDSTVLVSTVTRLISAPPTRTFLFLH